jgi:RNA recognition motif-containing protein
MNIYVGNLSYEVTEADLKQEFEAFGEVSSISIIKDNYSGQSKGFGFVEMPKLQEGQAAITGLNGKQIKGRAVTVNGARPKGEGGSGGGRSSGGGGRPGGGGGGYGGGGRGGGGRSGGGGGGRGGGSRRY